MPLDSSMVGEQTKPCQHAVDARWLMSYAAGLGDFNRRYMDTASCCVIAHPVFPVCLEWPVILDSRHVKGFEQASDEERARGVHAAHDLHLFKPIIAGETYETVATIAGLAAIRPGAAQTVKLETFDSTGDLVCRTWQLSISRGVTVTGGDKFTEQAPALPPAAVSSGKALMMKIPVPEGLAHIYTETARIWNPIHTDRSVALAAGLPDIILHGTASLALAITKMVDWFLDGDATRVTRLGGQFRQMVLMPSELSVEITHSDDKNLLQFRLLNPDGSGAIEGGFLVYR